MLIINEHDELISSDGYPKKDLFLEDSLHMNAAGYRIWQQLIKPVLKK